MYSQCFRVGLSDRNHKESGRYLALCTFRDRNVCYNCGFTHEFANLCISNVEFTAGILVCCMPTTTALFKRLKPFISSMISSYKKGLRSLSNYGAREHQELGSVTNLQPPYREQSCESSCEVTHEVQSSWTGRENRRPELPLEYEMGSNFTFEDARIRKTTDIKIMC